MKLTVKTLKGTSFEIEATPEASVGEVKRIIESAQGRNVYPADQVMIIYQGKILEDDTTLEANKVAENSFIVVMLSKNDSTQSILRHAQMRKTSVEQAQSSVALMLREDILTDITINAVGGSIRAHRAVLAAQSPVFMSMFTHDLREKELSTVDISDMSIDTCQAFVSYLYGVATSEELLVHGSELVVASNKYGIENLKKACEESMMADVSTENLLERLQMAHTYRLPALKKSCLRLLVDFGSMHEIPNDFEEFMKTADRDLVDEIRSTTMLRGRKVEDRQKPSAEKTRRRKSTPSQDSDGGAPGKRVRRLNVRLAGDEWAK